MKVTIHLVVHDISAESKTLQYILVYLPTHLIKHGWFIMAEIDFTLFIRSFSHFVFSYWLPCYMSRVVHYAEYSSVTFSRCELWIWNVLYLYCLHNNIIEKDRFCSNHNTFSLPFFVLFACKAFQGHCNNFVFINMMHVCVFGNLDD